MPSVGVQTTVHIPQVSASVQMGGPGNILIHAAGIAVSIVAPAVWDPCQASPSAASGSPVAHDSVAVDACLPLYLGSSDQKDDGCEGLQRSHAGALCLPSARGGCEKRQEESWATGTEDLV